MAVRESDLVFNIVITGDLFSLMSGFVASLIDGSRARVRLVANGCTIGSVRAMERFATDLGGRVVEVLDVSAAIVPHGAALDLVLERRDDGEHFCFVDPDIVADGAWLAPFLELLCENEVVSSGRESWTDDNVVDRNGIGKLLFGRHFYHPDGFVYGSPHLAMYRRAALDDTSSRWGLALGQQGDDLPREVVERLREAGHLYRMYDTAKVVNIMMQLDGYRLVHTESDALTHIGGLSHFLERPDFDRRTTESGEPLWTTFPDLVPRATIARHTAALLGARQKGNSLPDPPADVSPDLARRLASVHSAVLTMLDRFGPE